MYISWYVYLGRVPSPPMWSGNKALWFDIARSWTMAVEGKNFVTFQSHFGNFHQAAQYNFQLTMAVEGKNFVTFQSHFGNFHQAAQYNFQLTILIPTCTTMRVWRQELYAHSDYGLLLELNTLTLAACSYALLVNVWCSTICCIAPALFPRFSLAFTTCRTQQMPGRRLGQN